MDKSKAPLTEAFDEETDARLYERFVLAIFDRLAFLLRPFHVHAVHVRALLEFRLRMRGRRKRTASVNWSDFAFFATCLMMLTFGFGIGMFMGFSDGAYWRIPIGLSATFLFLSMILSSELGELATDRAEVDLVLPAPVEDSAVLVARLLYVGEMVFVLTLCTGVGQLALGGRGLDIGLPLWFAFYGGTLMLTAMLASLAVLAVYMSMIRVLGPERFKSMVAWVQVFLIGGVYLAIYTVGPILERYDISWGEPGTLWHILWPPFWFGGLYEVITGNVTPALIAFAVLALAGPPLGLVVVLRLARRKFLRALASPSLSQELGTTLPRIGWLSRWGRLVCRNSQQRAAYDWSIAMAKSETTFRVRLAPSILIFAAIGLGAVIRDGGPEGWALALVAYVTIVLAFVATESARVSESPDGRRMFASSPAWREVELRIGVTKALGSVFVALPGILATIVVVVFGSWWTVLHVVIATIWSLAITLTLARVLCKRLPFSEPVARKLQPNMAAGLLPMILAGIVASLHHWAGEEGVLIWAFAALGVALLVFQLVALERLRPVRTSELSSAM